MSAKQQFLDSHKREHATTKRVLAAYPHDKADLRPHDRSQTAKELVWTFAVEQMLAASAAAGPLDLSKGFPKAPATLAEAIAAYEQGVAAVDAAVEKMPESRLGETVVFMTGPKQMGDVPVGGFLWFLLMDHVHHRGQLSVYLRMAGGKVPSIYGPSADEPWR
jgi:uncharacterized damage-inducible protein DinB